MIKLTIITSLEWVNLQSNIECDAGAGEVYRKQSPGKVSDLETCKKSCEDDAGCRSITFFLSKWCSHFSTECTRTKFSGNAVSMRWGGNSMTVLSLSLSLSPPP